MSEEEHPWVQRKDDGETARAYAAFRAYMNLGPKRTLAKAAEVEGKKPSQFEEWSVRYQWVARCAAYDSYVVSAEVDGFAQQMASVRSRQMEILDLLLSKLLVNVTMLKPGQDPSIRLTQALAVVLKGHRDALELREGDAKSGGVLEEILVTLRKWESQ